MPSPLEELPDAAITASGASLLDGQGRVHVLEELSDNYPAFMASLIKNLNLVRTALDSAPENPNTDRLYIGAMLVAGAFLTTEEAAKFEAHLQLMFDGPQVTSSTETTAA